MVIDPASNLNHQKNHFSLSQVNWTHTFLVVTIHLLGLLALWFWPRPIDFLLFLVWYLATTLAIGVGYHRLLTHRGFISPRWMRRLLAWTGAAALQGGPARWATIHRRHHRLTDRPGDPHSPTKGFVFAHMGWVMCRDDQEGSDFRELAPDVCGSDQLIRVLDYKLLFVLPWLLVASSCYLVAGWRGVLWGAVIRTLVLWHLTWCINSVCHVWGKRPNATRDESRNVAWLGLLTLGEGWHNNHHARPAAAVHGWLWWEVDISGYVIRTLARLGLIRNVVREPRRVSEGRV